MKARAVKIIENLLMGLRLKKNLFLIALFIQIGYSQGYKVFPTKLVEQLIHYNEKSDKQKIVKQIYKELFPDSISSQYGYLELQPHVIDLDGDSSPEILALVGLTMEDAQIFLLKFFDGNWNLIFSRGVYRKYTYPELHIANLHSQNKLFYSTETMGSGTGVYAEQYHFFKLIGRNVTTCLENIHEAHLDVWGLVINQEVNAYVSFPKCGDEIDIRYKYCFYTYPSFNIQCKGKDSDKLIVFNGDETVRYCWDSLGQKYQPKIDEKCNRLDEKKIGCFGAFGDDSLFVSAFGRDIEKKIKTGPAKVAKMLSNYLDEFKKHGHVSLP
jgi:hypothetical protein